MEFIIIILGIVFDRLTKLWALHSLKDTAGIELIKNIFSFQYLENTGAAWGAFSSKTMVLAFITFIITCGMLFYLIRYKNNSLLMKISFALIISGALGNLYDRVVQRFVIDFIMFHYKEVYYFPTFNVADILVVCGSALLAIYILKDMK